MRCLCCGKEIINPKEHEYESSWHGKCIRSFFGTSDLPELDVTEEKLTQIAEKTVAKGITIPGIQKKMSIHLTKGKKARLTLVGHPAGYILKPQTKNYANLPEYEDLTMRLSAALGIHTVPHALIRTPAGLSYITKRIDRPISDTGAQMLAMEDLCQLSEKPTADKYKGSYENCAKIIQKYTSRPGIDMAEFYLRILVSYITANSDMHLKNFSLIETAPGSRHYILSDAYDLLPAQLILPADRDELALTLCGKRRNITRKNLVEFGTAIGIPSKTVNALIRRLAASESICEELITESYLNDEQKEKYLTLIKKRLEKIG